jgi:SpoVK/Ycf46/Vps4 family AAA+-type ATPase
MVLSTRQRTITQETRSERLKKLLEFLSGEPGLEAFRTAFVCNMKWKVQRYWALLRQADSEKDKVVETLRVTMQQLKAAADVQGDEQNWQVFETVSGQFRDVTERAAKFETLRLAAEARMADAQVNAEGMRRDLLASLRALALHDAQHHILDRVADLIGSFLKSPRLFRTKPLNIMLVGSAGCGKTTLAAAVGVVFARAGLFVGDSLIQAGRAELVAQYEGQTAARTRAFLTSHLDGGVIFIDEAYAITPWADGRPEGYGAEAASALVEFMTRYEALYCIIVAGYERDMTRYFLTANDGLSRRFPYKFVLATLTTQELLQVFQHHLQLQLSEEVDAASLFKAEAWKYLAKVVRIGTHGVVSHVEEYDTATRRKYAPVPKFIPQLCFLNRIFESQAGSMVALAEEAAQVLLAKRPYDGSMSGSHGEEVMREILVQRIQNCALSNADFFLHELKTAERSAPHN